MSCWVVPSLAAEFWRVPLPLVQQWMKDGTVRIQNEGGFTFVDVAPNSPVASAKPPAMVPRPLTYVTVTEEELRALGDDDSSTAPAIDEDPADDFNSTNMNLQDMPDWKSARQRSAALRRAPARSAA